MLPPSVKSEYFISHRQLLSSNNIFALFIVPLTPLMKFFSIYDPVIIFSEYNDISSIVS